LSVTSRAGPLIRRRFVCIGARTVHYRRAGTGSPVVMIHGSPANSAILEADLLRLAHTHTCFAFDTPGFGDSDALLELPEGIGSLADALAETLEVMGFPPCPVFGTHTGAAIALELARRHPARVSGVVLDGVPMYSAAEQSALFSGYFEPLVVDDLGSQFTRTWTRFRDLFMWFPWTTKTPATLNETDRPAPERLHLWVTMFYRSARTYAKPYLAAIAYGPQAHAAIAALRVPAVFMANDRDMLYTHLAPIPALRAGQSLRRTPKEGHAATIDSAITGFASRGGAPPDEPFEYTAGRSRRQFFDLPHGQVLVRTRGAPPRSPAKHTLLLLHDAPGSGRVLEDLIARLPTDFDVVLPDLPGCGESAGFIGESPTLADYAAVLSRLLEALSAGPFVVYGCGFGASLAAELCAREPARCTTLVVHGACLPEPVLRDRMLRHYAPRLSIEADGSHWYRTWLMLRDALVYFPWFDGTRDSLRRIAADFDAARLHALTFDVLKQWDTYHQLIEASLSHDLAATLTVLKQSIVVLEDPLHPFAAFAAAVRRTLPRAPFRPAADQAELGACLAETLAS